MKYPKFLNKGNTIGICAPSAGVGKKLDEYLESLQVLKKQGYKIKETRSVRINKDRSASAKIRAKEFYELTKDSKVDMIMFAAGGDYMFEVMPYVNYDEFIKNPKWLMGMSDPTNILYNVTCKLDIATLYGINASSYKLDTPQDQLNNLEILKGNIVKQKSFKKYQTCYDKWNGINEFKNNVKWISNKEVDIEGRIIGGCFEVIQNHLGTSFDYSKDFVERYKEDGIIWYFDIFACSPLDFYLGLLKMKYMGLFKYCKGVIVGRVGIPNIIDKKFDYIKAANKALGSIPHILEADIGHTNPFITIINGSLAYIKCKRFKGEISFKLS